MIRIFVYILVFGNILFTERELISYRLHSKNTVGIKRRNIISIQNNTRIYVDQNFMFYDEFREVLTEDDINLFTKYFGVFEEKNILKSYYFSFKCPIIRRTLIDKIAGKMLVPLVRFLPNEKSYHFDNI